MREVTRFSVNIYQPVSFMNTNSFKDGFVDFLLDTRNRVIDTIHVVPELKMSEATYSWLYRIFYKDTTFVVDNINDISFWGMNIVRNGEIEDGVIAFCVGE